ncbi:MAG: DUF72 domain-containing protein [Anaerolineae bacterium]|nr:DUF72 domain-containing protein [Anaerolineae bacterium]MDW8102897.1 DUF72 domain-containing protein [Anaerolineae bacterium]
MKVKVGCCGFPAAKSRYYETFHLVEVQNTFYKPPMLETAKKWRQEAPPDFEFTLKAWQLITHPPSSPTYRKAGLKIDGDKTYRYGFFRPTSEVFQAWETTLAIAEALEARVVVFQCPAAFVPTDENIANMRAFFGAIPRKGLVFAWEPRGEWENSLIKRLCEELELVHCVDPFQRLPVTSGLAYFRLHGKTGYSYRFTNEDLLWLKEQCKPFSEVYCLFNNVSMWESALDFLRLFNGESLAP